LFDLLVSIAVNVAHTLKGYCDSNGSHAVQLLSIHSKRNRIGNLGEYQAAMEEFVDCLSILIIPDPDMAL
jgi:hypothetical protein